MVPDLIEWKEKKHQQNKKMEKRKRKRKRVKRTKGIVWPRSREEKKRNNCITKKTKKGKLYYQDKRAKLAKKEGWIYYPPSDSEEKDIMKGNQVEEKEDSKDLDSKEVCEFCKKKFKSTIILKHIGHNQDCKSFYGNRFKELKVS